MKQNSEYRAEARKALEGNWGDAVLFTIVLVLIYLVIEALEIPLGIFGSILGLLALPLTFAGVAPYLGMFRGGELRVAQIFGYFKELPVWIVEFIKYVIILLFIFLTVLPFLIIDVILFFVWNIDIDAIKAGNISDADSSHIIILVAILIVGEIVALIVGAYKTYSYMMVEFLMTDDKSLTEMAALRASSKMMKGKKMKMFLLDLSFIGWAILCLFTIGLGFFLLAPYVDTAHAAFYEDLKAEQ